MTIARYRRHAGDKVGHWTLISELGYGGNSEVWVAENADGRRVALKLLRVRNPASEPYRRFRDEVRMHGELSGEHGILPLVAASLPERPTAKDPAWLATEIAVPLASALADARLEVVVGAAASIAKTLAGLHDRGIHHRDVKPANLFRYQRAEALGDFGLVSYPDKDPVTEVGATPGPRWFLAPEMVTNPMTAAGGPADVYSLAKSIWVLATRQDYPPFGHQRIDTPKVRIVDHVQHARAYLLDRLIERSTSHDPDDRPTMGAVAAELRAWVRNHSSPKPRGICLLREVTPNRDEPMSRFDFRNASAVLFLAASKATERLSERVRK